MGEVDLRASDNEVRPVEHRGLGALKDAAAALRDLTIVIGVYVYYAGFIYLHGFYDTISVDTTAVDLSPVAILANAFGPIWTNRFTILLILTSIGVAFLFLAWIRSRKSRLQVTLNLVLFDLAATLLASAVMTHFIFQFSNSQGLRTAEHARAGKSTDPIWFVFRKDEDVKRLGAGFRSLNEHYQLLLAAETKDFYFVVGPAPKIKCNRVPAQFVFRIAKSDVLLSQARIPPQAADPTPGAKSMDPPCPY